MDIKELNDKEVDLWKGKYKYACQVSRHVWMYRHYLEDIKDALKAGDFIGAGQLWNELDYKVQNYLFTAPTYGGPFTTEERAKIKELWEITADELEI